MVIGGLEEYYANPTKDFTTHNELYLIKPTGTITLDNLPGFKCIKVNDDASLYNPNAAHTGTVPAANAAWVDYHKDSHKCDTESLVDKYYKFIDAGTTYFTIYDVLVDQWGKRCFMSNGSILQLKLD